MQTDILIIGKGDDIITMILDNLYSEKIYGDITIYNNLGLEIKSNFQHPNFRINVETEIEIDHFQKFHLGVYQPKFKRAIVERFNLQNSDKWLNVIHNGLNISLTSVLGKATLINSNVSIAAHTNLGDFVSVNRNVSIGHHTKIENFVSINPGCNIAGHCIIGEGTVIGIGSQIVNGITIGKNTVIGAGSIVTRDIPDNVVAWGSPCKVTRQNL